MTIKIPKKFHNLYVIYQNVAGSNRKAKYEAAESIYRDTYDEYCFDDFRMFNTVLTMYLHQDVPFNSAVKSYVRQAP